MNEKFEYHINKIKKQMTFNITLQTIVALLLLSIAIYMYLSYEDPLHTYIFVGIIGLLLLIVTTLMFVMRRKLDWILANYETNKQDVIDYLNIYLKNLEYNKHRNFLFKISQRKEAENYKEAYKILLGYSFDDEESQ